MVGTLKTLDRFTPKWACRKNKKYAVDYALLIDGKSRAFIEAKQWGKVLSKDYEQQLRDYCINSREKPKPEIAVLTNGLEWRLYLRPLSARRKGDTQELRQFDEINIINAEPAAVEALFAKFLARDSIFSIKKTTDATKELYRERTRKAAVWSALQDTLRDVTTNKNVLAEVLEMLLDRKGIHPAIDQLEAFVKSVQITVESQGKSNQLSPKPISFTFEDKGEEQTINVKSFAEIFRKLSALLYELNPDNFSQKIIGIERAWVSAASDAKKGHESIGDSGVAINTGGNAKAIENRCRKLVASLGYKPESLTIQFAEI